jgi:ribosome recycling factor
MFESPISHLERELSALRTDRATPKMLDGLKVNGQPIKALAAINAHDPRTLHVRPYQRHDIADIDRAIRASSLGLNPINTGSELVVPVPPLSEERRLELCKVARGKAEEARIAIRQIRKTLRDKSKDGHAKIEDDTKQAIDRVNVKLAAKEQELMA